MPEITVTLPPPAEGKMWRVEGEQNAAKDGLHRAVYFEQVDKPSEFVMVKMLRRVAEAMAESDPTAAGTLLYSEVKEACYAATATEPAPAAEDAGLAAAQPVVVCRRCKLGETIVGLNLCVTCNAELFGEAEAALHAGAGGVLTPGQVSETGPGVEIEAAPGRADTSSKRPDPSKRAAYADSYPASYYDGPDICGKAQGDLRCAGNKTREGWNHLRHAFRKVDAPEKEGAGA